VRQHRVTPDMVHDFAKIRPEPLLERRPAETPPAWLLLFTGLISGLAIGVFACFMLYLSGNIPPLQGSVPVNQVATAEAAPAVLVTTDTAIAAAAVAPPELELEFYGELPKYEVVVNVTPVVINSAEQAATTLDNTIMLQTNAFGSRANAEKEQARLQGLGLAVVIKEEDLPGRTLFLVQTGPYSARDILVQAESILLANNIVSRRLTLKASL